MPQVRENVKVFFGIVEITGGIRIKVRRDTKRCRVVGPSRGTIIGILEGNGCEDEWGKKGSKYTPAMMVFSTCLYCVRLIVIGIVDEGEIANVIVDDDFRAEQSHHHHSSQTLE